MVKTRKDDTIVGGAACVYLLHFPNHSHYIGHTTTGTYRRLRRHLSGRGSRWVYNHIRSSGEPEIGAVVWFETVWEAVQEERRYKRYWAKLVSKCEVCNGKSFRTR